MYYKNYDAEAAMKKIVDAADELLKLVVSTKSDMEDYAADTFDRWTIEYRNFAVACLDLEQLGLKAANIYNGAMDAYKLVTNDTEE